LGEIYLLYLIYWISANDFPTKKNKEKFSPRVIFAPFFQSLIMKRIFFIEICCQRINNYEKEKIMRRQRLDKTKFMKEKVFSIFMTIMLFLGIFTFLCIGMFTFGKVGIAEANIIYQEDFNTDPGWTVVNEHPLANDIFEWDNASQSYRAQNQDEYNRYNKYALSDAFPRIDNQSFIVDVDIMHSGCGWGHYIGFHLVDSDRIALGDYGSPFSLRVDHDTVRSVNNFGITAPGYSDVDLYHNYTPTIDSWYNWHLEYDAVSGLLDYSITHGGTPWYQNTVSLSSMLSFNQIALGTRTENGESGTPAEMFVDNINIQTAEPIPEPTTIVLMSFGLLGILGVFIRQRRKVK